MFLNFNKAEFFTSYGRLDQFEESSIPEVVFSGRSNVGKSSFINKLVNRKSLARTSGTPGKTATINFFHVDGIYFVDLPGYGYAKVSKQEKKKWSALIGGYLDMDRDIRLVIQLIDIRHNPTQNDLDMINFYIDFEIPFIIALTKVDKLKKTKRELRIKTLKEQFVEYGDIQVVSFSSETGEGVDKIHSIIKSICLSE